MEQLSPPSPRAAEDSIAAPPSADRHLPDRQPSLEVRLEFASSLKVSFNMFDELNRRRLGDTSHSALKAQNEALQQEIEMLKSDLEFERLQGFLKERDLE